MLYQILQIIPASTESYAAFKEGDYIRLEPIHWFMLCEIGNNQGRTVSPFILGLDNVELDVEKMDGFLGYVLNQQVAMERFKTKKLIINRIPQGY